MQARLFPDGTIPECATPGWYADRERAPHLEQGVHQPRLKKAVEFVAHAVDLGGTEVVDLGAGDGGLLSCLRPLLDDWTIDAWGYDLQPSNIDGARERCVNVTLADVLVDKIMWGDIAVATEMLEHLVDPHQFVATIAEHCRFLVASSPAFETADSHYAFHLWAWDMDGYRQLVEQAGFTVVRHDLAGEFQVLLAER